MWPQKRFYSDISEAVRLQRAALASVTHTHTPDSCQRAFSTRAAVLPDSEEAVCVSRDVCVCVRDVCSGGDKNSANPTGTEASLIKRAARPPLALPPGPLASV